mmetsp:Transcript_56857/g.101466  ORF Transcript_56857/g.101466 Transcript_56857/m.101466 type:complete len:208 (+) Transcript_56857:2671-3294(+)
MEASASIPPTPHPNTPNPFTMVVWLSVPTKESGYKSPLLLNTTLARYSTLIWWTIPLPGGTMVRPSKAVEPHLRKAKRSLLRSNSSFSFFSKESAPRAASTMTEWSMTRSTGTPGLIFAGSPPKPFIASRRAAKSTTAGTPVKSCIKTRAHLKGISILVAWFFQSRIFSTSASNMLSLSQLRMAASKRTRTEKGSTATRGSFSLVRS